MKKKYKDYTFFFPIIVVVVIWIIIAALLIYITGNGGLSRIFHLLWFGN
nr:MAG TPA: hypothetical protein [Caudoviricetes sp.]